MLAAAHRQGAPLLRGGREPHRRLVLERSHARPGEPDRAARVRVRAAGEREEDWRFTATVEVQPKPEPADWTTARGAEAARPRFRQEAVQAELERCSRRSASSCPSRGVPPQDGDTAVVDLISEDGSAQRDYVVELGSERLVEEIENGIRGLVGRREPRDRVRARGRDAAQRDRRRSRI